MIVNSKYNEKTGTANVVVRGKHGDIGSGKARLHEEDREYGSELVGCGIAHARARINLKKKRYQRLKAECEANRKFVQTVMSYKNFDKTSDTAKCMFKQMNAKIAEVNRLATEISNDMTELEASITKREYLHKKMSKSRN